MNLFNKKKLIHFELYGCRYNVTSLYFTECYLSEKDLDLDKATEERTFMVLRREGEEIDE